ncbi:MAG: hypothetical protein E7356_03205 [Clostridiales bacterium]|nr:hypothetical protein [Clostridiales bacterium]
MALYLTIVALGVSLLASANLIFFPESFDNYAIWIIVVLLLSVVAEIAITATFSFLAELLPEKWFNPKKKLFQVSRREQRFYEKLGIKIWKDRICELGDLIGHNKKKVKDPKSVEYVQMFILESNRAMVGHYMDAIASFAIVFMLPFKYFWRISMPVAIIAMILNLLPTMILRYNLPKFHIILKRLKRLEGRLKIKPSEPSNIVSDKVVEKQPE